MAFGKSKREIIVLMLCIGTIQISLYYFAGATIRPDRAFAAGQPDTLLYCQAARRIAEGAPFSFSAGEAASTGTTSVVYPFILALPYLFGADELALVRWGFVLNAAFYLVFLAAWGAAIWRMVDDCRARVLAMLLLAGSAQPAFAFLSQSDAGLFAAASSLWIAAMLAGRRRVSALLLLLLPWIRPEGAVCALALFAAGAYRRRWRDCVVAAAALGSAAGVLALNWHLTGMLQFSSVAKKGYFVTRPWADAVVATFHDAVAMLRQVFFGGVSGSFREHLTLPFVGGLLFCWGMLVRDWRRCLHGEAVFLLAAAGGLLIVAQSGWAGTNADRYLTWLLPYATVAVARGVSDCSARLTVRAFAPLCWALAGFAAVSSLTAAAQSRRSAGVCETRRAFFERCEQTMTLKSAVGTVGNAGAAFSFSPRRLVHLSGIYSAGFLPGTPASRLEHLKHQPADRPWYWLYDEHAEGQLYGEAGRELFGETVIAGPQGLSLRHPDWRLFDRAAVPPPLPEGCSGLRCSIDVGLLSDEQAAGYEVWGDYLVLPSEPVFCVDTLSGGERIAEAGRLVLGGDGMTLRNLAPGRPVKVVMRTLAKLGSTHFASPQELHVEIDGNEIGHATYELPEEGFADAVFALPGSAITGDTVRLELHGDHYAFAYWFFQ